MTPPPVRFYLSPTNTHLFSVNSDMFWQSMRDAQSIDRVVMGLTHAPVTHATIGLVSPVHLHVSEAAAR